MTPAALRQVSLARGGAKHGEKCVRVRLRAAAAASSLGRRRRDAADAAAQAQRR